MDCVSLATAVTSSSHWPSSHAANKSSRELFSVRATAALPLVSASQLTRYCLVCIPQFPLYSCYLPLALPLPPSACLPSLIHPSLSAFPLFPCLASAWCFLLFSPTNAPDNCWHGFCSLEAGQWGRGGGERWRGGKGLVLASCCPCCCCTLGCCSTRRQSNDSARL